MIHAESFGEHRRHVYLTDYPESVGGKARLVRVTADVKSSCTVTLKW